MKHLFALLLSLTFAGLLRAEEKPLKFSDLDDKSHTPLTVAAEKKGVVLVFVSPYCPISNAFTPEVNKIAAAYGDKFSFYLVEAEATLPLAEAKKHRDLMEIKAPLLLDPELRLAKLTKAKWTPEAVVLNGKGETLYQGRVNDLYATQFKKLKEPKTHDLKDALDAIAAGKPVATPSTKPIGCSISGL